MKSRIAIVTAVYLLILVAALFTAMTSVQPRERAFPAVIRHDCSPWDWAAFTISIPVESRTIQISVWRSPAIKLPVVFSFPDETGKSGYAFLLHSQGDSEELSGRVTFEGVSTENPVEGRFDFISETGEKFTGKFTAAWDREIVMCG